jgi:CheY-like chemotaxis protein
LIPQIDRVLATYQLPPTCLLLEIDDQVAMEDAAATTAILLQLQIRGLPVCIDNFGERYATLDYLHQFPVAALKISRLLVGRIGPDKATMKLLETIVILAKDLGMMAIAKGIDTPEQLLRLKEIGLQYGQGYFFSQPSDADSVATLMAAMQDRYLTPPVPLKPIPIALPPDHAPLVLVVDDDRSMRSILKSIILKEGYRVMEASSGTEGIALYQSHQPDLVLLDAVMPDIDGFSCCQQIRQIQQGAGGGAIAVQHPSIVLITALDDPKSVDRAFEAGATDYITKPVNWPVLRQRLPRLLRK